MSDEKDKVTNKPSIEKLTVLLMAALAWSESSEGQAAMMKANSKKI